MAADMPQPDPNDDHSQDTLDAIDEENQLHMDACAYMDEEAQRRLWVRTIIPLLQLRSHDSDPSGRVQLAFDLMHIAACERVTRLLRSDLRDDQAG
jgi:hypothetical protein